MHVYEINNPHPIVEYGGEWIVPLPELRDEAIAEMLNELSEVAERTLTLDDVTMTSRPGKGGTEIVTMVIR